MSIFFPYIAIGGVGRQPLAGHSLVAENRPYLLTGVLGVPLIDDIAKRSKIIAHLVIAVHSVIDGDKADAHLWKADFRVHPNLQIVPAKPGHVLDHHHIDQPRFNISHHLLKARAFEVGAGKSVIFINPVLRNPVAFAILGEDFNLVGNAVAVSFVLVITGESDVKSRNFS